MSKLLDEKPFSIEIAKKSRAVCKACGLKCLQGELRITKCLTYLSGVGKLKAWHHVDCIFELFLKQRLTTKRIESQQDIDGWHLLDPASQCDILKKIEDCNKLIKEKFAAKYNNNNNKKQNKSNKMKNSTDNEISKLKNKNFANVLNSEDSFLSISSEYSASSEVLFRDFRVLIADVAGTKNQNEKTKIINKLFRKGGEGNNFRPDIHIWIKLLLPALDNRSYKLQSQQLVNIFSKIFDISPEIILDSFKQKDIGYAIQNFFEQNNLIKPVPKSILTLQEVDDFLQKLSQISKEEEQIKFFENIIKKCTSNDLKILIRLIDQDLRMRASVKNVLEAISSEVYQCYTICKDLNKTIEIWKEGNLKNYLQDNMKNPKKKPPKDQESKPKRKLFKESPNISKKKKLDLSSSLKKFPDIENDQFEFVTSQNSVKPKIPNYFENIKLLLENGVAERYAELIRYFIAYGGVVVTPEDCMKATHVLHSRDTVSEQKIECSKSARHVMVEWIKHSIANESLQDHLPYTVRWVPELN